MHKGIYCHFSKLTIYKIVHTAERHRFFLVGLRSFFLRRLHVLSDSEKLSGFLFSLASSLTTPPEGGGEMRQFSRNTNFPTWQF